MPVVNLDLDSRKAVKGLDQYDKAVDDSATKTDTSFGKMRKSVNNFGKVVGIAMLAAGAAVTAFAVKAIGLASTMEETQNKYNVVFRGMTETTDQWVEELRANYAVSEQAAMEYLASTKAVVDGTGLETEAAANLSNKLVLLAQDLASFHDKAPEQAVRAMTSALTGEFEAMKQFGVVLKATEVEQQAMIENNLKTKDSVTNAMKAQAAYTLILQKSGEAQGDTIRSQESYAFQLKQTKALVNDLVTGLGMKLLPLATEWLTALNKWAIEQDGVNKVINFTIEAIRFVDNGIRGLVLVAKGTAVAMSAAFVFITESIQLMLAPLNFLLDALVKIGFIDTNPLERLVKFSHEFLAAQVEGFKKTFEGIEKANAGYDAMKKTVEVTNETVKKTGEIATDTAKKAQVANETQWKASVDNVGQAYDTMKGKAVSAGQAAKTAAIAWTSANGQISVGAGTAPDASSPGGGFIDPNTGGGAPASSLSSSFGGARLATAPSGLSGSGPTVIGARPPSTQVTNINITEKLSRSDVEGIISETERLEARA